MIRKLSVIKEEYMNSLDRFDPIIYTLVWVPKKRTLDIGKSALEPKQGPIYWIELPEGFGYLWLDSNDEAYVWEYDLTGVEEIEADRALYHGMNQGLNPDEIVEFLLL